jgi:hypothetical protein
VLVLPLQHGSVAALQLQALDEAGKRAARLLPASPSPSPSQDSSPAVAGGPLSPTTAGPAGSPLVPAPPPIVAPPEPKLPANESSSAPPGAQHQQGGSTAINTTAGSTASAAQEGTQPASQLVPLLAVLVRDIAEPPAALATLERLLLGLRPGGARGCATAVHLMMCHCAHYAGKVSLDESLDDSSNSPTSSSL